jgi:hypothetical protein
VGGTLANIAYASLIRVTQQKSTPSEVEHASSQAHLANKIIAAWAWWFFSINTTMTASIIYRIAYVIFAAIAAMTHQLLLVSQPCVREVFNSRLPYRLLT